MTILVTGGTGFIGSHTCVELLQDGFDVVIADNLCNSKEECVSQIEAITGKRPIFYQQDVRDLSGLNKIFSRHKIDGVIHFAGLKAVGESMEQPLLYYENNLTGAICLLQAMQKAGCKTIVFSSSATVYGLHNPIPYVEGMPTAAVNPYGATKVMIEQILIDQCAADPEWSAMLLRYFNPIGAHESGLIGESPNGIPNNLVPYIAKVATGELPFLRVFGNDYPTCDGTGVRDYIHVMDLAAGHVNALRYAFDHKGAEPVNLGTGKGTSVLEILSAYSSACGKELPYEFVPRRPGDIAEFYADTAKAEQVLGWKAKRSIDEMCRDSWHFTQNALKKV